MRVAHIVAEFSPLTQTFIYDTILESARQGVDTHVITNVQLNTEDRPFEPVYVVRPQPKWHPSRLVRRAWKTVNPQYADTYDARILDKSSSSVLKQIKPDIIHAHFGDQGWAVLPVAKSLGMPLVVSFHGYDAYLLPQQKTWRDRYAALFEYSSLILVVSQHMKDHLIAMGAEPRKIHIIHVGKKLEEYPIKPISQPIYNWISVGRLVEKKGHDDCIRAFSRLTDLPDLRLTIVGDGPMSTQLQQLIMECGLGEKVRMVSDLSHKEVKRLMNTSDAFILCSKTAANGDSEGIPTVLMEAQALGLPCVSTRHSGIPEVFPEESHTFLADEGDVNAIEGLMRKVIALHHSELAEIVKKGRQKIQSDFNVEKETETLIAYYRQL